jgi:hypothetical protein
MDQPSEYQYLNHITMSDDWSASLDPNDYNFKTKIDPPHPFIYDLSCMFISLPSLEMLSDPGIFPGSADYKSLALRQKPPFLQVTSFTTESKLDLISLYELDNMPYLAVVKHPNVIVFVNLTTRATHNLECLKHKDYEEGEEEEVSMFVLQQQSLAYHGCSHTTYERFEYSQVNKISLSSAL